MANPPLCCACEQAPRKYKCPRCLQALCSLPCSRAHKTSCGGAGAARPQSAAPPIRETVAPPALAAAAQEDAALPIPLDAFHELMARHPGLKQRLRELDGLLQQADDPRATEGEAQRAKASALHALRHASRDRPGAGNKRKRDDDANLDDGLADFVRVVREHAVFRGAE